MYAILFRRMEIDGVNYYQLYRGEENFEPSEEFADYANRNTKEYFYIDGESDFEIPDPSLLNIYCDNNNELKPVEDFDVFTKVFSMFAEKYNIVVKVMKPIDNIVENVNKKIMFQDDVIAGLLERIYLNQSFVTSDLPTELKKNQKVNILFHGLSGSGKKTIIDCIQKELGIPYADITLNGDVRSIMETITTSLLSCASNSEEASCGIVYIHDNFEELSETMGDVSSVFNIINYLTSQEIVKYNDKKIDFRTITFVVLFDDDKHDYSFRIAEHLSNCAFGITTRPLTNKEKYQVLFSENGRIYQYEKFLNSFGKKLIVDDDYLMKLITRCSKFNPSMEVVNRVIDTVISYGTFDGINDIVLNKDFMDVFGNILDDVFGKSKIDEKDINKCEIEKYKFEKRAYQVYDEVRKYVIGQDKQVLKLIKQILSNQNVANDNNLYSPESYRQNILVRGCTGSGKTFIAKTVCKMLGIPYYIADATSYTEEGYVGLSISDMYISLYHAAGDDLEKAQKGILIVDEIDKKAQGRDNSGPSRKSVLNSLLKPAEGTIMHINVGSRLQEKYVDFDTSRVTFICEGAFTGIEQIRDERIGKSKIGFGNQKTSDNNQNITKDDYITYGVPEEFMGRVNSIIELDENTKEDLINIMKKSELSALKIKKYLLAKQDLDIEYTNDFYEELAKAAIERKQGVRGIANALEELLSKINIQDIRASEVEKIVLDGEVIKNPEKVILIKREKQKKLVRK